MNCEQYKNLILESFGDENITSELKEHLNSCPECNAYYNELNALAGFAGSDDDFALAPNEIDRMVDKINSEIDQQQTTAKTTSFWRYYVPVAAAVVLMFGISWKAGFFNANDNTSDNRLRDSLALVINETDIENDLTGDDLNILIGDYSNGVTTFKADQVVDELTEEEYEYLAQNLDMGDIL